MPKTMPTARAVSLFTAREIASLLKRVRLIRTVPEFSIKTGPKSSIHSRILIIASKKMGTAPMRNLVKRRFKSLFYEEKLFLNPFDVVVYCKKGAERVPYQDLKLLLSTLLKTTPPKESVFKESTQSDEPLLKPPTINNP